MSDEGSAVNLQASIEKQCSALDVEYGKSSCSEDDQKKIDVNPENPLFPTCPRQGFYGQEELFSQLDYDSEYSESQDLSNKSETNADIYMTPSTSVQNLTMGADADKRHKKVQEVVENSDAKATETEGSKFLSNELKENDSKLTEVPNKALSGSEETLSSEMVLSVTVYENRVAGDDQVSKSQPAQLGGDEDVKNANNTSDSGLNRSMENIPSSDAEKGINTPDLKQDLGQSQQIAPNPNELLSLSVDSSVSSCSSGGAANHSPLSPSTVISAAMGPVMVAGNKKPPQKKRMWYQNIFSTSYKTRSAEFKKIFKELTPKERLIVDYSCALQREILVQGRMYISQNYVSFHANIFGWETHLSIRFKDITSITKEKTALLIPNAIQITTGKDVKYFFASLVSRDATHLMLFKIWQASLLEESMPATEVWRLVHACYGDELGVEAGVDELEDFMACSLSSSHSVVSTPTMAATPMTSSADFTMPSKSILMDAQIGGNEVGSAIVAGVSVGASVVSPSIESPHSLNLKEVKDKGLLREPVEEDAMDAGSESSDYEEEVAPQLAPVVTIAPEEELATASLEIPPCPTDHGIGKESVNTIIPCDVDTLFTLLFTNSKFYLDFHTSRKTFDINQSEWQLESDGQKTRKVSFTVTLSQMMGPRHTQVTESQVMLPCSQPGSMYAIDSESVNAGIPYAESFYVACHYCLTRVSASESRLVIINQLKYRKSVWGLAKGFIEKNSWAGMEEFYSSLQKALLEECTKVKTSEVTPCNTPKLRKRVKKGMAPKPPVETIKLDDSANNGIPNILRTAKSIDISSAHQVTSSSSALKYVVLILTALLFFNAYLCFKLFDLEKMSDFPLLIPHRPLTLKNVPQNHQEWLELMKQQEQLHRIELQKWHEILMGALDVLKKAEVDLNNLKGHIKVYNEKMTHPVKLKNSGGLKEEVKEGLKAEDEVLKGSKSQKVEGSIGETERSH